MQALDIPADWIEAVDADERRVLERMNRDYAGDRPPPELAGRTVILVDEGAAERPRPPPTWGSCGSFAAWRTTTT